MCGNGQDFLAAGLRSGLAVLWNIKTGTQSLIVDVCPSPVSCLGFSGGRYGSEQPTKLLVAGGIGLPMLVDCDRGTYSAVPLDRVPTVSGSIDPEDCAFDGSVQIIASNDLLVVAPVHSRGCFYTIDPSTGKPAGIVQSAVPIAVVGGSGTAVLLGDKLFVRAAPTGSTGEPAKLHRFLVTLPAPVSDAAAEPATGAPSGCGYMSVAEALLLTAMSAPVTSA